MEAKYYIKEGTQCICQLCPHYCKIQPGKSGICKVRRNVNGKLFADTYGILSAANLDPVEKKPLYHFFPGKNVFSLGNYGCNMHCKCCQNYHISQKGIDIPFAYQNVDVRWLIEQTKNLENNIGVAYTYNEPAVWYEFMIDIASVVHKNGFKNIIVSNGYINKEPLLNILPFIDAFNIDIKGFNDELHKKFTGAESEVVRNTVKLIYNSGKHLEITYLIIPGFNDSYDEFEKLIHWIVNELDKDVPLHISRYYPAYQYNEQPIELSVMEKYYELAEQKLSYVYLGNANIPGKSDTYCKNCGKRVIERQGYFIKITDLEDSGRCSNCNEPILTCY